jgi:hypothetical protein
MTRRRLAAVGAAFILSLLVPSAARADGFPLVGWWPMNEGSGQIVRDWSGHGNTGYLGSTSGTDANDPTWVRGVLFGSALRFDGLDDYVTIPDSSSLQPQRVTVAAWVRGNGSPGVNRYVLSKGAVYCMASSYGLYTGASGGISFYVADASSTFYRSPEAPPSIWDGQWHNVAGTYDGSTVRLYVDGQQVGTGSPGPAAIGYDTQIGSGQIGGYPGACPDSMTLAGDIDGVQVWSQALSVDSIWRSLKALFTGSR